MDLSHSTLEANKLLSLLSREDRIALSVLLRPVSLERGKMIAKTDTEIDTVYFLTSGIGSVLLRSARGRAVEAGLFGFDGYVPTAALAGAESSSYDVVVQIPAEGFAMDYVPFRRWMDENRRFQRIMIRSMEAFAVQLAYTAVSNAIHEVPQRLARWLLMCDDRIAGNEITLTHEYLSIMLGVRRPSVTTSLHELEGRGLIRARRGNIVIRNRKGLEQYAQDAYGYAEREYYRLMHGVRIEE